MPVRIPLRRVGPDFESRWPGSEALATECAVNLMALTSRIGDFAQALTERHGMPSPAAFNLLAILERAGSPLAPSEIAARMIVTRPTISGILASLASRGLVTLARDKADGRRRTAAITRKGRARLASMLPDLHRRELEIYSCLNEGEKAQLLEFVERLLNAFPEL